MRRSWLVKDYRFCLTIAFRTSHLRSVARASHWMAGLIRRALRVPGVSRVQVDINLAERR